MKYGVAGSVVFLLACSVSLSAQWGKFQQAGVPRDAKGAVRMDAPPPRTPDGKPDLSGNWLKADRDPFPPELAGLFSQRNRDAGGDVVGEPPVRRFPPDPKSPPVAAFWDIAMNIPAGLPLTPWAADIKKKRVASDMKDNPDANCMPMGITQFHQQPQPRKIVQTPKLIVILYESNYGQRFIYLDGRKLPPAGRAAAVVVRLLGGTLGRRHAGGGDQQPARRGRESVRRLARRARHAVQRSGEVHRADSVVRCSASWRSTSRSRTRRRSPSRSPCASTSA
jgi:hypothetical protein